jgi:hypothetical protein
MYLGMHAVDRFAAVIPAPDILTLAVGATRVSPRWDGGSFQPRRRVMDPMLSVDHRALRLLLPVEGGRIVLIEFDGPRTRTIMAGSLTAQLIEE